jgi:hypothetical protein
MLSRGVRLCA